jgi:hypothetical protein
MQCDELSHDIGYGYNFIRTFATRCEAIIWCLTDRTRYLWSYIENWNQHNHLELRKSMLKGYINKQWGFFFHYYCVQTLSFKSSSLFLYIFVRFHFVFIKLFATWLISQNSTKIWRLLQLPLLMYHSFFFAYYHWLQFWY